MMGNKGRLRAKVQRYLLDFTEDEKQIKEQKQKRKDALERLVINSKARKGD